MFRHAKASAAVALCCTIVGGLFATHSTAATNAATSMPAATKIEIDGKAVNVSCSGTAQPGRPVVVLLAGLGDGLETFAGMQQTLGEKYRVCSYDRLGEGASDQPDGPQSFDSTGKILTGVLKQIAPGRPVVLVGHSLGGLIAARYAPRHRDMVKGLVLLDATPSTMVADTTSIIPESATGPAGDVRAQSLAVFRGENPEKLVVADGPVRSAGTIPVEVIRHGQPYLAGLPEYGPALESAWSAGQTKWLKSSHRSILRTAEKSGHYIHIDEPRVAVAAVERVAARAAC